MQIRSHFSRLNIRHEINLFLSAGQPGRNCANKLCPHSGLGRGADLIPRHPGIMDTRDDELQN